MLFILLVAIVPAIIHRCSFPDGDLWQTLDTNGRVQPSWPHSHLPPSAGLFRKKLSAFLFSQCLPFTVSGALLVPATRREA